MTRRYGSLKPSLAHTPKRPRKRSGRWALLALQPDGRWTRVRAYPDAEQAERARASIERPTRVVREAAGPQEAGPGPS